MRIAGREIPSHIVWIVSAVTIKIFILSYTYNRLVDEEHIYHIAHGNLVVQMQKREALNKKTLEAVETYVAVEKRLYDRVIVLSGLLRVGAVTEAKRTRDEIAGLAARLSALREASPRLTSTSPYLYLMETYRGTEQDVAAARAEYNGAVDEYNTFLKEFPINFFAKIYRFKIKKFFTADKDAIMAPLVAQRRVL